MKQFLLNWQRVVVVTAEIKRRANLVQKFDWKRDGGIQTVQTVPVEGAVHVGYVYHALSSFLYSVIFLEFIMILSEFSTNLKISVFITLYYSLTVSFSIIKAGESMSDLRKREGDEFIIIPRI